MLSVLELFMPGLEGGEIYVRLGFFVFVFGNLFLGGTLFLGFESFAGLVVCIIAVFLRPPLDPRVEAVLLGDGEFPS